VREKEYFPRANPRESEGNDLVWMVRAFNRPGRPNGAQFDRMDKQAFIDAVRTTYFMPQPSIRNIWYNLKYRSALFMWLTMAWFAVFLVSLLHLRYLRGELKYLTILAAYIWCLFLIYHLGIK